MVELQILSNWKKYNFWTKNYELQQCGASFHLCAAENVAQMFYVQFSAKYFEPNSTLSAKYFKPDSTFFARYVLAQFSSKYFNPNSLVNI